MKDDKSISKMFHRLQVIANDLKVLGEKINDDNVSHRFLMCLPPRFETLRLIIIRGGLKQLTPNQVLGDVTTQETYRVKREGVDKDEKKKDEDKKKKSVAFKASSSSKNKDKSKKQESSDDEDASDIDDEAMALFICKMGKFMKKKGYGARKRRDHNKEYVRRCYKCKSKDHIIADCPYNSDNDEDDKKKEKKERKEKKEKKEKEKKMTFQKKKKGGGYVVTWDSDGSSYSDDSSDDDKKSLKKALASIAINNKPSIFDTPLICLMAKPTKVKYDVSDHVDCESDDCRSNDEEEEYTEELLDMCEQVHTCFEMKRKECKELRKKVKSLEQSFDELNATHERLMEAHEKLGKAHSKFEKAHSSLLEHVKKEEAKKEQVIVSCDMGLTCDILDESFCKPIIVARTNPFCRTTTSTLPLNDGFTYDASLIVENETLKKEVNELTRALGKAYDGEDHLLMCLGSQRSSLYKERLSYTSKKGKVAFSPHKTSFVKNNGRFCTSCKQVGHKEHDCKNKKSHAKVSSIRFDSCYMLVKGANGVKAKFISAPHESSKKKAIWVPKTLVTNLRTQASLDT
jgi:hypothetical protein